MIILLDFPPADLFPNRAKGKHWAVMHKSKVSYRESSAWITKREMGGWAYKGGEIEMRLTFYMPDKRHRDADNCLAAAKAGLDGMAEALGVNDKNFNPIVVTRVFGAKPGKLIVELMEKT